MDRTVALPYHVPDSGTANVVGLDEPMTPRNDTSPAALPDHTAHPTCDAA